MWGARQIATAAALGVGFGVLWLAGSNANAPDEGSLSPPDSPSATSTTGPVRPDARRAVPAPPELPGESAPAASPGLDFTRPEDVAHAYLIAAHSLRDTDRNTTNRRVLPYLAPTNPDNPRGLVVTDAPPAGQETTAAIDQLRVATADQAGQMIAYEATWSVSTGTVGQPAAAPQRHTSFVVLQRQPDGRWLVTRESVDLQPGD